jgi:hypothetical protein
MNAPSFRLGLFSRWRRRIDDLPVSEPADLGTAFGLEWSMLSDEEIAPTAPTGAPGGTHWWRRKAEKRRQSPASRL